MSEQLVVMPLSDWQDIVDSVREKTGKTEELVSGEVASEIDGISRGINPEWTNWQYFSYNNNRNSLVAKLKYEDTSRGTAFNNMFSSCTSLTEIPNIDTSRGTVFNNMFSSCTSLTEIPNIDTSQGTVFSSMFGGCISLTEIPNIDTSQGTAFNNMFTGCAKLKTIPKINLSKGMYISNVFSSCAELENITFEGSVNIKGNQSFFNNSPKLTVDSLMSFVNALSDNTGLSTTYKVTIGSTNLAKLTPEQIQIATDKNITLA